MLACLPVLALSGTSATALDRCEIALSTGAVSERFITELALTDEARAVGLMARRWLAPHHAMLFDFGQEGRVSMWMKDTLISLDMAFFKSDGTLAYLEQATAPGSLKKITPPMPVRYVVEINTGASRLLSPTAPVRLDIARLKRCLDAVPTAD